MIPADIWCVITTATAAAAFCSGGRPEQLAVPQTADTWCLVTSALLCGKSAKREEGLWCRSAAFPLSSSHMCNFYET